MTSRSCGLLGARRASRVGASILVGAISVAGLVSTSAAAHVSAASRHVQAASRDAGGGTCFGPATGTAYYTAGVLTQKTFPATFTAHYRCHTSDPTIRSAIESGTATLTINCLTLTATESGTDTFTWSNGRTSRLTYVDRYQPLPISDVRGTFVSGEFKGMHLQFLGVAAGNPIGVCAGLSPGTTTLYYAGAGWFGDALG